MTKRNLMTMFLAATLCLCWLTGCGGPSAEDPAAQAGSSVNEQEERSSLPPAYIPPDFVPGEGSESSDRPPDEVIAAIDEAGGMEPYFLNTDDILLLWPETDEAMTSPLECFIGGWGVVLSDGTVVLNEAHCHATYDENGQPRHVDQEPVDHAATVIVGLELPEEWRGLTLTIIAPMAEGYPYYVGTGLPRVIPEEAAPHKYEDCGLWYWQDDRYVRVFEGVDHGETFRFEPATISMV